MKADSSGFSLIELLVAIAIGLTLMITLISLYFNQIKTYQFSQALERLQENGRVAQQQLTKDINMAGYCGCGRLNEISLYNSLAFVDFNLANSLLGFHDGYSAAHNLSPQITQILATALAQTDQILIQAASAEIISAKAENSVIKVQEKPNFNVGNILLIANCNSAALFQVAQVQQKTIIPTHRFTENYSDENTEISRFSHVIYYLADTGRKNLAGDAIHALYRRDLMAASSKQNELVEGVEDMQIRYGVTNSTAIGLHYLSADQVQDWEKVRVVKIALLLASNEVIYDRLQSYRFQNRLKTAPDRRLRREWDITAALRER